MICGLLSLPAPYKIHQHEYHITILLISLAQHMCCWLEMHHYKHRHHLGGRCSKMSSTSVFKFITDSGHSALTVGQVHSFLQHDTVVSRVSKPGFRWAMCQRHT